MSRLLLVATVGWFLLTGHSLSGQQLTSGFSGRSQRDEVLAAIPVHQFNPAIQQRVSDVLKHTSLYRHLPKTAIQIDRDYLTFLCCYPEVIVEIWRLMEVTNMSAVRTAPFTLHCSDGEGTISAIDLIYATDRLKVYLGEGTYEGPLLRRKIRGDCLIVLRTEHQLGENGMNVAICDLDFFLKIDNATAGFIAKTVHPLVGRTADQNFVETMKFVERLHETTCKNGPGVQGMAHRLTGLTPEVRDAFIEIAGITYRRQHARSMVVPQPTHPASSRISPTSHAMLPGSNSTNLGDSALPSR